MSSSNTNNIAMAALSALVFAFGAKTFSDMALTPKMPAKPGYELPKSAAATGGGGAAAAAFDVKKIFALMPAASADAGQDGFKKCAACHTVDKGGANKVGPNLYGVVGRKIGGHEGFNYSDAMKGKGGIWDWDHLVAYIHDPRGALPGNKMAFAGISDERDLADMMAYLRKLADAPAELPK